MFCTVPRQRPALNKRSCRIILRYRYSSLAYSECLKCFRARCEKPCCKFECTKWLATCISLEAVRKTRGENTRAHSASKHSLLQAGVFRATRENPSPGFRKKPLQSYFSFLLSNMFAERKNSYQSHKNNYTRVEREHMPGWRCVHTSGDHFLMS